MYYHDLIGQFYYFTILPITAILLYMRDKSANSDGEYLCSCPCVHVQTRTVLVYMYTYVQYMFCLLEVLESQPFTARSIEGQTRFLVRRARHKVYRVLYGRHPEKCPVDLGRDTRTSTQSRRIVRRKDASWSLNWPSGANLLVRKQHMYFFWCLCDYCVLVFLCYWESIN